MMADRNIVNGLQKNLWQFGLNPKDWQIHFGNTFVIEKVKNLISLRNVRIINKYHEDFYFSAEALLEQNQESIKAQWQNIKIMGL